MQNIIATIDIAVFAVLDGELKVLLRKREKAPSKGQWSLPGGYVYNDTDKTLDDAVTRITQKKMALPMPYFEQVITVGNNHRDPRGWSTTTLYFSLLRAPADVADEQRPEDNEIQWINYAAAIERPLAFDHCQLIKLARERLRNKAGYSSLAIMIMPKAFTLNELQGVYEILTEQRLDKKSFRRRMLATELLVETGEMKKGRTRSAALYTAADSPLRFFSRSTSGQSQSKSL